jgi:hypothetical protein
MSRFAYTHPILIFIFLRSPFSQTELINSKQNQDNFWVEKTTLEAEKNFSKSFFYQKIFSILWILTRRSKPRNQRKKLGRPKHIYFLLFLVRVSNEVSPSHRHVSKNYPIYFIFCSPQATAPQL